MGCANCANNKTENGQPRGCNNNGLCQEGGCGVKMHVFDWLTNMELPEEQQPFDRVEVRFKNDRKAFFRNIHNVSVNPGDVVVVEGTPGMDVGIVSLSGELVRLQMKKKNQDTEAKDLKKLLRKARQEDIDQWQEARSKEEEAKTIARNIASELNLEMKVSDVEYQGDGNKATFYYTAEKRVDFREMIKLLADKLKVRIEMRQIGARQEAGRIGGIGDCGRELCCSTWLSDFRSVSTSAARYQQLSLNPQKLAGQCGKLKCCLNFELDMYLEALKDMPNNKTKLQTEQGKAFHMKTDIFKRQMWYLYEGEVGGAPVPLSVERVKEIIKLNEQGHTPTTLKEEKELEPAVQPDLLDQESVTRFDQQKKKKKGNKGKKPRSQAGGQNKKSGGNSPNRGKDHKKGNSGRKKGGPGNKGNSSSGNNKGQ